MKVTGSFDTIAAISTPPGEGGIGVIRVSGDRAEEIGKRFFKKPDGSDFDKFEPRFAHFGVVIGRNGERIDTGIGIFFRAPLSYTGEDVFEFQLHGSPLVLKRLLEEIVEEGVRLAEPGEFTKRAFLNGKLDLLQAEAVIDIIQSTSKKALENAEKLLEGELSRRLWKVRDELKEILLHLESAIDFPEEDLELEDYPALMKMSEGILRELDSLLESYFSGRIFQHGLTVTIVGMPNVGKSRLMNRLLRRERAIVSDVPGTTRDFIEEKTLVAGIPLRLIDTAGLRDTDDPVERIGIDITRRKIEESDVVLFVFDASREPTEEEIEVASAIPGDRRIIVVNKMDIGDNGYVDRLTDLFDKVVFVSAKTGEGLADLENLIRESVEAHTGKEGWEVMLTSERQYRLVREARDSVKRALEEMRKGSPAEFTALEVRAALERIGELTGEFYNDELLDEIFGRFCIGK